MSRCPKSDAAANAGDMDNLYKVSADFEMKPKKPGRIKGSVFYIGQVPHVVIKADNPDALVEQVARAMIEADHSDVTFGDYARAALRSIGVPLKKS
jgi:hypothetical protein